MFLFFVINIFLVFGSRADEFVSIETNSTKIIGVKMFTLFERREYMAFRNIPYAEPPVDTLRFQPPKPHASILNNEINDYSEEINPYLNADSEDCLYLDIYVPFHKKVENFAVMVWLHEDSIDTDPDFFIEEEVIVVNINYRTGIFGFLNTNDNFASGNMGAKDVLMALRWIRNYIPLFNGDPNRVTVCGRGPASTIVASLLTSFAAEDLFQRVIIQSGSALSPADYSNHNFEIAVKLYWRLTGTYDKFDRKKLYQLLTEESTQKLITVSRNIFDSSEVRDEQRLINSFAPSVETLRRASFMNKTPVQVYERLMTNNNVEVMIGFTSLESIHKLSGLAENRELLAYLNYNFQYLLPFEGNPDEFESPRYKKIKRKIMEFYFVNGTVTEKSLRRYAKYISDQTIYPIIRQAILHQDIACKPVYLYRFSFNGALNIHWQTTVGNLTKKIGATTGDEICYLFRCKSFDDVYNSTEATSEKHFIKKITRLWANFVKYGNPTPAKDLVIDDLQWRALRKDKINLLNLDHTMKMAVAPETKRMEFWNDLKNEYFTTTTAA